MKTLLLVVVLCGIANGAAAMSGAEFMQSEADFAKGYAFGVTEYRVGVLDKSDPNFMKTRSCIIASGISSDTIYQATLERLKTHPSEMAMPAFGAVLQVLSEMCPKN